MEALEAGHFFPVLSKLKTLTMSSQEFRQSSCLFEITYLYPKVAVLITLEEYIFWFKVVVTTFGSFESYESLIMKPSNNWSQMLIDSESESLLARPFPPSFEMFP